MIRLQRYCFFLTFARGWGIFMRFFPENPEVHDPYTLLRLRRDLTTRGLGKSEYSGEVIKNTRDDEMTRFWDSAGNQSRRAFEN